MRLPEPWRRRTAALACVVASGAPMGAGVVGVLGTSLGVDPSRIWIGALCGFLGALGGALLIVGWWIYDEGERR
jgi:hypothetical protein